MKSFYVYIMANQRNGTLYVGSTSDIIKRIWEHKNNVVPYWLDRSGCRGQAAARRSLF